MLSEENQRQLIEQINEMENQITDVTKKIKVRSDALRLDSIRRLLAHSESREWASIGTKKQARIRAVSSCANLMAQMSDSVAIFEARQIAPRLAQLAAA